MDLILFNLEIAGSESLFKSEVICALKPFPVNPTPYKVPDLTLTSERRTNNGSGSPY